MFLLVDNYDSFTFNLWHFLGELGAGVEVRRNDHISVDEALAMMPRGIVISPGPCDPDRAGICVELVRRAPPDLPILGVCLGHQCIGQAFGAAIVRAPEPMHGKMSPVLHRQEGVFAGLPDGFLATRYHSLIVQGEDLPASLGVTARTADGLIMGLQHVSRPVHGVQFHPESVASDHGYRLLANFMRCAGVEPADDTEIERLQCALGSTAA